MIGRLSPSESLRRAAAFMLFMLIALTACDQAEPAGTIAADNPSRFAQAKERSIRVERDADDEARSNTPGAGLRQGMVRGINAGHLGLQMVLRSVVSDDGELRFDRLDSALSMDLIEQTIETYSSVELPEQPHEQLVCYCNAYNVNALAILSMLAMDTGGAFFAGEALIERVKGDDGAARGAEPSAMDLVRERFDDQPVLVANEMMTMRELREDRILGFNDPRVLAYLIEANAMTRAPSDSLWPRRLDAQLDALCTAWVNEAGPASVQDGQLLLSQLLQRHAAAFEGETYGGVLGFLRRYADPDGPLAIALGAADVSAARAAE
jgi:hypothetical protein